MVKLLIAFTQSIYSAFTVNTNRWKFTVIFGSYKFYDNRGNPMHRFDTGRKINFAWNIRREKKMKRLNKNSTQVFPLTLLCFEDFLWTSSFWLRVSAADFAGCLLGWGIRLLLGFMAEDEALDWLDTFLMPCTGQSPANKCQQRCHHICL